MATKKHDTCMSPGANLTIAGVDLDSPNADHQIAQAKQRLDLMSWYLVAREIDEFFKRWPDLKWLVVEHNVTATRLHFKVEEWVQGPDYTPPKKTWKPLREGLEALGVKTTSMTGDSDAQRLKPLLQNRYILSTRVMAYFGNAWVSAHVNPEQAGEQWISFIAEVGMARLAGGVNPAKDEAPKPLIRM